MTEVQAKRSVAVVVAGMHRSGTSAVTRMLAGLGCALPKTVMEGDVHNAEGYWESPKVANLNDAVLASAGSSWDDWEGFDPAWYSSSVAEGFGNQALAVLHDQFGESPLFVLKDPRICRLLPFWKEALARFGASVHVVVPLRNPLEVAASLKKRDAIDLPFAILIWLRNVLTVEADSRGLRRAFVDYAGVLRNADASADRLAAKLDLRWPSGTKGARSAVAASLKSSLRHHCETDAGTCPSAWANAAFEIVERWACDDEHATDADELDRLRALLDDAVDEFALPMALGMRNGQRAEALDHRVEDLESVLSEKDQFIESLDGEIRERDRRVAERDAKIDEVAGLIGERDVRLAIAEQKMHEQAQVLDAKLAERDARVAAAEEAVSDRDHHLEDLESALKEKDQFIETLDGEIRERDGRVAERDHRLEDLESALKEKDQFIETLDGEIRERDGRVAERDTRIAAAEEAVSDRDRRVADRDAKIDEMTRLMSARDLEIAVAERTIHEQALARDALQARIDGLTSEVVAGQARIDGLTSEVVAEQQALQAIHQSTSWRVTKPLRMLKVGLSGALWPVKATLRIFAGLFFGVARGLWRMLPLGSERRRRLRSRLLVRLPAGLTSRFVPVIGTEYRAADWLDLPDLAFDAANDGGPVPILFDPHFYVSSYKDVAQAGISPLEHYMRHGAIEGRLPLAIDRAIVEPLVESLHRFDFANPAAFAFDADFYRAAYVDVANLDDASAEGHFERHGRLEARVGSKGQFLKQVCASPCEIPLDFDALEYLRLYPDLAPYARSELEALRHYMVSGRWEPRLHTLRLGERREEEVDAPLPIPAHGSPPLAILLHVYYAELWEEMAAYIRNIPANLYRLHVNVVDGKCTEAFFSRIRSDFPNAEVNIGQNVGRDIGGHCQLLRNIDFGDFRYFLLMHTKKSPHLGDGGAHLWRRRLLMPLLGGRQIVADNVALFDDQNVGQIGGKRCRDTKLDNNEEKHRLLLTKLGIDASGEPSEFVSGTMMFLRREVMQRVFEVIKDTPFENGDDKPLAFHLDSQWAHAVERLFGDVVSDMGYRTEWR